MSDGFQRLTDDGAASPLASGPAPTNSSSSAAPGSAAFSAATDILRTDSCMQLLLAVLSAQSLSRSRLIFFVLLRCLLASSSAGSDVTGGVATTAPNGLASDDLENGAGLHERKSSASVSHTAGSKASQIEVTNTGVVKIKRKLADGEVDRDKPMTGEERVRALKRFSLGRLLDQSKPERGLLVPRTL
jgi:hypothetical protein